MRYPLSLVVALAIMCQALLPAHGQLAPSEKPPSEAPPPANPPPPTETDAVAFRVEKPRSMNNRLLLGSMLGAATVLGAIGLGFHLDSREKSDEVSRAGELSGLTWTQEREDTRKSAIRSRNVTIGFYAAGSAVLAATIITFIVTQPGEEVIVTSGLDSAVPTIVATDEGAVLGARWSFQ